MDKQPVAFSNDPNRCLALKRYVEKQFAGRPYGIVWVKDNATGKTVFKFPANLRLTRILIVFEGLPVALGALKTWHQWAVDDVRALDVRTEFVAAGTSESDTEKLIDQWCEKWCEPLVVHETIGLKLESHIHMGSEKKEKDDPDLLTMMFGSMGELLTRIDLLRKRFSSALDWKRDDPKPDYLDAIDELLAKKGKNVRGAKAPAYAAQHLKNHIPRLLLRGETGVGKTLIARYLHNRASRPPRILIPEYLHKEDMFEYALFGYAQGHYTGGRDTGDHGLLLENVGGVVFLDEIGEANDAIQAKLLGYLDDYMIRPRGWIGDPFYCPTLVVAATNRPLEDLVKQGKFRSDLLRRFTDTEDIPPLRKRIESLPFILDCLLQSDAINPKREVSEIGAEALKALKAHPFPGNFRELEDLLRAACQTVAVEGRHYICRSDLRFESAVG